MLIVLVLCIIWNVAPYVKLEYIKYTGKQGWFTFGIPKC